jgi:hypothetical protein
VNETGFQRLSMSHKAQRSMEHPVAIEEESVDTSSCRKGKHGSVERERRKILVPGFRI